MSGDRVVCKNTVRCPSCGVGLDEPATSDDCPIADEHASPFIDHECEHHSGTPRHAATCQIAWRTRRSDPASTTRWIVSSPLCDSAADAYERGLPGATHTRLGYVLVDVQRLPL